MEQLLHQLKVVAEAMNQQKRVELRYGSLHEFVLRFGKPFQAAPLSPRIRRGEPKRCFENSAKLAAVEGWLYVEGFGTVRGVGLAIHHAWVCEPGTNIVIDPTTDNIDTYFGVAFTHAALRRHWKNYDSSSIIDNWHDDWPLLKLDDDELRSWWLAEVPVVAGTC